MPAKRDTICEVAAALRPAILCLQETKIDSWSPSLVREIGGARLVDCIVLPAIGSRGGIAILWDNQAVSVTSHAIGEFAITAKVTVLSSRAEFWLTTVYGPADDARKEAFLLELARTAPPASVPWLLNGDFNIIYEARDKNNLNLNRRIMGRFRSAIDVAGLREIKCENRQFTWSNERQNPTLVSIDKFFCNISWESLFPAYGLMAASTACSDHCPLLLASCATPIRQARFRFESFCPKFPRFQETVQRAWQRPVQQSCAFARLRTKMLRTAYDLKIWSKSLFSDAKVQFHIVNEVILRLDVAQEKRILTNAEFALRKLLKIRLVGLAAIEKARKRQSSRLMWLRAGDASTKFFNAKACSRRRKNIIYSIQHEDQVATVHDDKAKVIHDHFSKVLAAEETRQTTIN